MFDFESLEKDLEQAQKEAIETRDEGGNQKWQGQLVNPLPEGCRPQWKCQEGEHALDVIPWKVLTDIHPQIAKGSWAYKVDYWRHEKVGLMEHYLYCPLKTINKRCPVCEHREAEMLKSSFSKEYVDKIKPKHRTMYYVWIRNNPTEEQKGLQFWEISYHAFEDPVQGQAKIPFGGGTILFMHPSKDRGKTVYFKRTGKGATNTKYLEHKFLDRRMDIPQQILEQATISLESIIPIYSYDKMYEIVHQAPEANDKTGTTYSIPNETPVNSTAGAPPDPLQTQSYVPETQPQNECPKGGRFGEDCDSLPANLCGGCKKWDACSDALTKSKSTQTANQQPAATTETTSPPPVTPVDTTATSATSSEVAASGTATVARRRRR